MRKGEGKFTRRERKRTEGKEVQKGKKNNGQEENEPRKSTEGAKGKENTEQGCKKCLFFS